MCAVGVWVLCLCLVQEAGRLDDVLQAVVNPSDEALWNLMTASSNQSEWFSGLWAGGSVATLGYCSLMA